MPLGHVQRVLFDNLDKGWSPHGLTTGDMFIGEGQEFDPGKLESILSGAGVPADKTEKVIQFMLTTASSA